jgi:O-antigen ligase
MIWKTSEKLIQDNYLWGIGPGNFQNKYLEYQKFYPPYLEWAVPHPHNIFLAFWLYSGIIGFAGFLILLGFFFREFFAEQKSALKFMALGIMLVILIHGLFDTTYFKNDLAVFFWLAYLGMMKSGNKDEKKIREI